MAYEVRVMRIKQDGKTGYTEVWVRAEETRDNAVAAGPEKGYGIEANLLGAQFGGKVENWLQWVKIEHQKYHGLHADMTQQLHGMVGKTL